MTCKCDRLPRLLYLDRFSVPHESLFKILLGDWSDLHKCKSCGQLWRIDKPDRLQEGYAFKLDSEDDWEQVEVKQLSKDLLLQSRGGITEQKCIWKGCTGFQVRGVAFCIDHLYETGARR